MIRVMKRSADLDGAVLLPDSLPVSGQQLCSS
jgi:hypothetical protein